MLQTSARLLRLLSLLQPAPLVGAGLEPTPGNRPAARCGATWIGCASWVSGARFSGHGGGYQLGPGSSVPPVLLKDDEAVAVALALRAAAGSVGKMEETSIGLLAKLDQVLPARLRKRASALHSVTMSLSTWRGHRAAGGRAHAHRFRVPRPLKLKLNYKDRDRQTGSSRSLEPLRLAHTGNAGISWRGTCDARTGARSASTASSAWWPWACSSCRASFRETSLGTYSGHSLRGVSLPRAIETRGRYEVLTKQVSPWCGGSKPLTTAIARSSTGRRLDETLVTMMVMAGAEFEILDAHELMPEMRKVVERLSRTKLCLKERPV